MATFIGGDILQVVVTSVGVGVDTVKLRTVLKGILTEKQTVLHKHNTRAVMKTRSKLTDLAFFMFFSKVHSDWSKQTAQSQMLVYIAKVPQHSNES